MFFYKLIIKNNLLYLYKLSKVAMDLCFSKDIQVRKFLKDKT